MLSKIAKAGLVPQVVSAVSALVAIRIYSELLSPSSLGLIMLVLGIVGLVDSLCSMTVNQTVFYFTCRNKRFAIHQQGFWNQYKYKLFILCVLLIGIICDLVIVILERQNQVPPVLSLLIAYAVIDTRKAANLAILNAFESHKKYGLLLSFDSVISMLGPTIAVWLHPSASSLLLGLIIARFFSLILSSLLVDGLSTGGSKLISSESENGSHNFSELSKYALPFIWMGALGWLSNFADRFILAWVAGLSVAGIYALIIGIVGRPYNVLTATLTTYFRPSLFKAISDGSDQQARKIKMQWLFCALTVGLVGAFLFWFLADYIAYILLAKQYQETAMFLMPFVAISFTLTTCIHVYDNSLLAMNEGKFLLKMQLTTIPIGMSIIAIGCSLLGVLGGVIGRIISEFMRLNVMHIANSHIRKS